MEFTFGGKKYELEYNNYTLLQIEELLEKPILEVISDPKELNKLTTMSAIVYCGIVSEKASFKDFVESINFNEIVSVQDELGKLITNSFNTGEEVKKK